MSVFGKCEDGYILDQQTFVAASYRNTVIPLELKSHFTSSAGFPDHNLANSQDSLDGSPTASEGTSITRDLCYKSDLFAIDVPFMMDSEFQAALRRIVSPPSPPSDLSSERMIHKSSYKIMQKKRKKSNVSQQTISPASEETLAVLTAKFVNVRNSCPSVWLPVRPLSELTNNTASRAIAQTAASLPSNLEHGRFFANSTETAVVVRHESEIYVLPAKCRFISSFFCDIGCLLEEDVRYDLIVVDPPWENKSAKRLKTYDYMNDVDLLTTPIPHLAANGAVIVLWLTNNERLQNFVETRLFPAWKVRKEAEWAWIKVTKTGETVFAIDSTHKKPFEKLVFARFGEKRENHFVIPNDLILVGVPSAVHSHKPSLGNVLKPYLKLENNARCLELFARSLTPGWTSWGLEVLKLQNVRLFDSN